MEIKYSTILSAIIICIFVVGCSLSTHIPPRALLESSSLKPYLTGLSRTAVNKSQDEKTRTDASWCPCPKASADLRSSAFQFSYGSLSRFLDASTNSYLSKPATRYIPLTGPSGDRCIGGTSTSRKLRAPPMYKASCALIKVCMAVIGSTTKLRTQVSGFF